MGGREGGRKREEGQTWGVWRRYLKKGSTDDTALITSGHWEVLTRRARVIQGVNARPFCDP